MQRRRITNDRGVEHMAHGSLSFAHKPKGTLSPVLAALGALILVVTAAVFVIHPSPSPLQSQQEPTSTNNDHVEESNDHDDTIVEYHVVFSTGCSTYQDWQSFVFFYQAMASQQPGTVTRIVSGCDADSQATLQQIFDDQIAPMNHDRFHIHFTPDYSRIKSKQKFVYFNKPFGMRHWMEKALGFPNEPVNENAIIILMDPDQLILRPFTKNNFTNTQWKFTKQPYTRIEHGKPMGQLYGFGLQWKDKVDMNQIVANSPVTTLSRADARAGFIVGPPYIATARDMYQIVTKWCEFAVPVHDQYPHLLAEMFAYCLAAAHLQLPHQTAASFMVSDIGAGGEGWAYVDKLQGNEVCFPESVNQVPNVIHFCQRYGLGKYFFGKRKIPQGILSCEAPLLRELPANLETDHAVFPDGKIKSWTRQQAERNRFMLCHLLRIVNAAAEYYKRQHCLAKANFEKTLGFHENMDES